MEFVCFSLIILMACVMCRRSPFFKNKRKNSPFYYSAISIFSFRFSVERRRHICRKCLQKPSTGSEWGHRHENKPEILISLHYNRFEIIDHPGQIFDRVNETFSRRWWWWWRRSSSRKWFVLLPSPIIFFFLLKNVKHLRTFSRSLKVNLVVCLLSQSRHRNKFWYFFSRVVRIFPATSCEWTRNKRFDPPARKKINDLFS